jgi:DNA-binding response OmpR family regulator
MSVESGERQDERGAVVRVLWVENHTVFARLAGRQFLTEHDLIVVPSLALAREALAARTFDAVLVDYDLDDGKGATLVAFLRQFPTVPVVIATSAHEEGNGLLLAAGADAACPKGRFAEISTVLARVVAGRARTEAAAAADRPRE